MIKYLKIAFISFLFAACGTTFKQQSLYDEFLEPEKSEEVSSQIIYEDGAGTMWNSLFECGDFKIVKDVFYAGNSSIKISWDKGKGCDWIGFGNSYSNWGPSDLTQYRNKKALSFYVRTQQKVAGAVPIVLGLEDFAGGGTYLFTDTKKYLYGLQIDTTWKQMIVPMWHFTIDPNDGRNDDVDPTAIKQLKFQLEGAGSFYLDEIKLIDYSEEEYQKMLAEVEAMKPKGNINQIVYREGNLENDTWGYGEKFCHELKEIKDTTGNTIISWDFKVENCEWAKWAINWNDWYQVNFRGIENDAMLQFKLKTANMAEFNIAIEDFAGHYSQLFSSFSVNVNETNWTTIEIPLKDFQLEEKGFRLDQIKQIVFIGKTSGTVYLDDIKIMDGWKF